jgi:hypothetical protein
MAKRELNQGVKLFRDFNSREPEYLDKIEIPRYDMLVFIGPCLAIEYLADDGYPYRHKFKKSAAPDLCTTPDGKQLVLVGGNFTFTERGITDR